MDQSKIPEIKPQPLCNTTLGKLYLTNRSYVHVCLQRNITLLITNCSNLNIYNECVQLEVKRRTDHPILFPRALSYPNCMTGHPLYYHVRIQYVHCAPATQRQT